MEVWNSPLLSALIRMPATWLHRLLKLSRPRAPGLGAHALALTPERKVILVKLRYAPGWRLPGGGRGEHEDLRDGVLRELREEVGMVSHGAVRPSGIAELLIVEDVRYRPRRWSWEVERIMEAPLDALPGDLPAVTARWLTAVRASL